MTAPTPYLHLRGTARQALAFYAEIFGCRAQLHTYEEFGRTDGPPEAIAHGYLADGPVILCASDAFGDQPAVRCEGMMLALLGTAAPVTMHAWFDALADGGRIIDNLQQRRWGDFDGQLIDRYGLHWLLGFQPDEAHRSAVTGR